MQKWLQVEVVYERPLIEYVCNLLPIKVYKSVYGCQAVAAYVQCCHTVATLVDP